MKNINIKLKICLIFGLFAFNSAILIADEVNESEDNAHSGGYFKIGVGYRFETSPYNDEKSELSIFLDGGYQWENGIFVEAPGVSNKLNPGFTVGYNLYNTQHWNFDFIGNSAHGIIEYGVTENDESIYIKRDGTFRAGFRATGNYGQNTIQFNITPYSFNDEYGDGIHASVWFAKQWQIKNWNAHASIGVQYLSEEILDYYYGIPDEIAISNSPAYKAKSGFNTSFQIGADYPISQNWVFESYLRYTDLADSINDSPIMYNAIKFGTSRSENITEAGILVNYVF